MPGATRYVVSTNAGLRALDGSTLAVPYRFEFSTPLPKLVDSSPESGARGLEPNTTFTLHFSQPIDPQVLSSFSQLRAARKGGEQALAFRVVQPDPSEPKRFEIRPTRALPIHTRITLSIAPL